MTTDDAAAYDIRDAAIDLHDKLCGEMLIHGQCDSLADNECGVEQAIAQAIRDAVADARREAAELLEAAGDALSALDLLMGDSDLLEGDDSVEFLAYRRLQTAIERIAPQEGRDA